MNRKTSALLIVLTLVLACLVLADSVPDTAVVVDEEKMRAVTADAAKYQAVSLAVQENYSAVIRLIADYSLAGIVLAGVLEGQARKNVFGIFTGRASVRLLVVTSSVTKMGGQTSSSRQVAFTEEEAVIKSIESAVDEGMKEIYF